MLCILSIRKDNYIELGHMNVQKTKQTKKTIDIKLAIKCWKKTLNYVQLLLLKITAS